MAWLAALKKMISRVSTGYGSSLMRVAACLEAVRVQRLVPVVALIAVCGDDVDVPTALVCLCVYEVRVCEQGFDHRCCLWEKCV